MIESWYLKMVNLLKLLRLTFKELKAQKKLQVFLVFNLVLGLLGFSILQTFQKSLSVQTQNKAQEILGADFQVSSRRKLNIDEIDKIEKNIPFTEKTEVISFFAMLTGNNQSRLVQVVAFDSPFPLYGQYQFSEKTSFRVESPDPIMWIDSDVATQFGLEQTEIKKNELKLGELVFQIQAQITVDPTRTFQGGGLAPRVFIQKKFLEQTGLIQQGSTTNYQILYKLQNPKLGLQIEKQLSSQILDSTIRFETAEQDAESDNRVLKYFTDYLGLVSLIAMGLCFLCGGYLMRWIFLEQKKTIAIYKTLGLYNYEIISLQILKNSMYSILAFVIATGMIYFFLPVVQNLVTAQKLPLDLKIYPSSLFLTFFLSLLVPQALAIPTYLELLGLNPIQLFQAQPKEKKNSLLLWGWMFLMTFMFWGLSVWQSNSFQIGSLFTVSLITLYFIFKFILFIIYYFLDQFKNSFSWKNKYAILGFIRRTRSSDLVFITMSMSLLILTLLPHIKTTIISEIRPDKSSDVPQIFMFDIQPEQKEILQKTFNEYQIQVVQFTPMVRSRILKLNNEDYERKVLVEGFSTREQEEEARFRNRGVNLTYKLELNKSEKVIEGEWMPVVFDSNQQKVPFISLEKRYAKRIGAQLNDILTFDIQGVEVQGIVKSIRQVKWTSFQPNFFIVFQSGVLEESPQMFLSSVSGVKSDFINDLQLKIVQLAPNVSMINVKQTAESALVFIDQMALALQVMAYLSIFVGLFIFIVLLNTQLKERMYEMNLLQILGLGRSDIKSIFIRQFVFLMALAMVAGFGMSFLTTTFLVTYLFDLTPTFDYRAFGEILILLIPVLTVALLGGLRPLDRLTPNELIRAN